MMCHFLHNPLPRCTTSTAAPLLACACFDSWDNEIGWEGCEVSTGVRLCRYRPYGSLVTLAVRRWEVGHSFSTTEVHRVRLLSVVLKVFVADTVLQLIGKRLERLTLKSFRPIGFNRLLLYRLGVIKIVG